MIWVVCVFIAQAALASELVEIRGCKFIPTDWADGDSFCVELPDGQQHTVRLYGADCIEWHVTDQTDARRLREQRRYFGITYYQNSAAESIKLAKEYGEKAYQRVESILQQPFTLYTTFADARGDGKYKRIYGFISTASGQDLSE